MRIGIAALDPRLCPQPVLPCLPRGDDAGAEGKDLGVSRRLTLASASGWWFLAFAAMQVPVGAWLDRVGPRLTTGVLLGLGAAGAVLFAQATGAFQIKLAMALIGVGLRAGADGELLHLRPAVFTRRLRHAGGTDAWGWGPWGTSPPRCRFPGRLTAFGWRETVLGLAAITGAVALAILLLVRDPPAAVEGARGGSLAGTAADAGCSGRS
jgi:MFS family permease